MKFQNISSSVAKMRVSDFEQLSKTEYTQSWSKNGISLIHLELAAFVL